MIDLILRSRELTLEARVSAFILVSNTYIQEVKQYLAFDDFLVGIILHIMEEMKTRCLLALDGVDGEERCFSIIHMAWTCICRGRYLTHAGSHV